MQAMAFAPIRCFTARSSAQRRGAAERARHAAGTADSRHGSTQGCCQHHPLSLLACRQIHQRPIAHNGWWFSDQLMDLRRPHSRCGYGTHRIVEVELSSYRKASHPFVEDASVEPPRGGSNSAGLRQIPSPERATIPFWISVAPPNIVAARILRCRATAVSRSSTNPFECAP